MTPKLQKTEITGSLIVFICALVLYSMTLAQGVTFEDSGELITSAVHLGIAHPPGYPLYNLIGHLFSGVFPFNRALGINLMSAFFSAMALGLFFILFYRISKSALFASAGTGLFLISRTLWITSVTAEVYSLNLFLFALTGLLLWSLSLKKEKGRVGRKLIALLFLTGLGAANHQSLILILPGIALTLFISGTWKQISLKQWVLATLFFMLGLFLYIYLPIRSSASPAINWGQPSSWNAFLDVVLRRQYGDLGFSADQIPLYFRQIFIINPYYEFLPWTGILYRDKVPVKLITYLLFFGPAVFGFLKMKDKRKWGLLSHAFFFSLFIILSTRTPHTKEFTLKVFFLPFWSVFILYFLNGVREVYAYFLSENQKKRKDLFLFLSILCISITGLIFNYSACNIRNYPFTADYAHNMLKSLPPHSILFTHKDNETFPVWENLDVELRRADIKVINYVLLLEPWYSRYLQSRYPSIRNDSIDQNARGSRFRDARFKDLIYSYFPDTELFIANSEIKPPDGFMYMPYGSVYRIIRTNNRADQELFPAEHALQYRNISTNHEYDVMTMLTIQNYALLSAQKGEAYYSKGKPIRAEQFFNQSILFNKVLDLDINNFQNYRNLGVLYFEKKRLDRTIQYWSQAIQTQPNAPAAKELIRQTQALIQEINGSTDLLQKAEQAYKSRQFSQAISYYLQANEKSTSAQNLSNIGDCYFNMQNYPEAIRYYEKAIFLDESYVNAYYNLGGSYYMLKRRDKARQTWEKGLMIDPNEPKLKSALERY